MINVSAAEPRVPEGHRISAVTVTMNQRGAFIEFPFIGRQRDILTKLLAIVNAQGHVHNIPSSDTVMSQQVSATCPCTLQRSTVTIPSTILGV